MARKRQIPFGYRIENGIVMPCPGEAEAVRQMFDRYISGDSYLTIANAMTAGGVRYHADAGAWNKHMIKRILENARYTGADDWPEVVSPKVFELAAWLRTSKTDSWCRHPDCVKEVKRRLICGICGAAYHVRTEFRNSIRWWHCSSDVCSGMLRITDHDLEQNVTALLNRLIAQPALLDIQAAPAPLSLKSEHMQSELYRELGKTDWNEDHAIALAFACAAAKYESLGETDCLKKKADAMKARLQETEPLTAFDREFFCEAADSIEIGEDGEISLRLISGALIGSNTNITEHSREVKHHADTEFTA
ncbi:MAG: recombinase family protein [Spirochaetaceae bacterium]|jgi:hypothetical protein|nr:recombinase family protein [Spirochaetaceae bacterium]